MDVFKRQYPDLAVTCCESPEEVLRDCDAAILVTEWPQYREMDWEPLARVMRTAIVLDGRMALDRGRMTRAGFRYVGLAC
jgi:UDPglucose 6-dehydrogenase